MEDLHQAQALCKEEDAATAQARQDRQDTAGQTRLEAMQKASSVLDELIQIVIDDSGRWCFK